MVSWALQAWASLHHRAMRSPQSFLMSSSPSMSLQARVVWFFCLKPPGNNREKPVTRCSYWANVFFVDCIRPNARLDNVRNLSHVVQTCVWMDAISFERRPKLVKPVLHVLRLLRFSLLLKIMKYYDHINKIVDVVLIFRSLAVEMWLGRLSVPVVIHAIRRRPGASLTNVVLCKYIKRHLLRTTDLCLAYALSNNLTYSPPC
jgi:hypothetical protein